MVATLPRELADERTRLLAMTVDQYHRLIENGVIEEGEPYELLNGHVVRKDRSAAVEDPMTINPDHVLSVKRLAELATKLTAFGCHLQTQQPVTLPPYNEPEPDAAIIRGTPEDYARRHPSAADVTCIIEVADASLRRDRTTKQQIYADTGIPQYVIVNLPDRVVEVYTEPLRGKGRYGRVETLHPKHKLTLPAAGKKTLAVPVRRLLPPA